ncbi:MAG: hypothetical protein COB94_010640 [Gammaproteobacteria bacterium]|nr:hypothetical protein [Gammaproteobacteria bacterium]
MTARHDTRAALATKIQQRQLTVKLGYYAYQGKHGYKEQTEIAEILLKGKWRPNEVTKYSWGAGKSWLSGGTSRYR